jgi:methionyl aminopeptidase
MDKEILQKYKKAGEIAKEMQDIAKQKLKIGSNLFEFAELIESEIEKKGGKPAFPINLSKNNIAAHYTPSFESKDKVEENDVIKVDIGVHVDGFIADSAMTIDFSGKYEKMVMASKEALEEAVKIAKHGIIVGKIGEKIQTTIREKGFNPIQNLSGHGVAEYDAHTGPSIPNIQTKDSNTLKNDMAVAIEPFATDGTGYVIEGNQAEIFQLNEKKPIRNIDARKIVNYVQENYKTLPFAERWLQRDLNIPDFSRKIAIRELLKSKTIMAFPLLKEQEGKIVTQAETTLVFFEDKVIRLV